MIESDHRTYAPSAVERIIREKVSFTPRILVSVETLADILF